MTAPELLVSPQADTLQTCQLTPFKMLVQLELSYYCPVCLYTFSCFIAEILSWTPRAVFGA